LTGRPNSFYYRPHEVDAGCAEAVDPHALRHGPDIHRRYLFGVLAELDLLLPGAGLTFWVTWDRDTFEERFRDAIAIFYDDDQLQKPVWAPAVSVIFKTVGLGPESLRWTASLPPEIAWRMALRDARNFALEKKRFARGPRMPGPAAPTFQIPLGASALVDLAHVPLQQRELDIFYAGSIGSAGRFTVRPRVVARRQLEAGLQRAREQMPELRVDYRVFAPFGVHFGADAQILSPSDYAERLAASKYALCPRGNVEETYRFFEAARLGCVPISEPLPPRWYFADAPYARVRRWTQLPDVLRELRRDERGAAELAEAARAWWRDQVAEQHVARFMHARIPPHVPARARRRGLGARAVG
jgi:hypothetical protein